VIVITGAVVSVGAEGPPPPPPQATRKTHIAGLRLNSLKFFITQSPNKNVKKYSGSQLTPRNYALLGSVDKKNRLLMGQIGLETNFLLLTVFIFQ
jgi:hypothetical protein